MDAKTAVEAVFTGKERQYNRRLPHRCAATSWWIRRPLGLNQWRHNERPCTPASGWERAIVRHWSKDNGECQVENQVGLVRERFFTPRLRLKSLEELNAWLLDKCVAYAKANPHPEERDKTIWEMFEAERLHLVPYAGPFDGFHEPCPPRSRRPARCASTVTKIRN